MHYDPAQDPAVSPKHYQRENPAHESIEVIRGWLSPEEFAGFCKGSVLKYLARAGRKEGEPAERDYAKARWYLDQLLRTP